MRHARAHPARRRRRAPPAGGVSRAFTLLEMVLVLFILALLSAVAIPRYGRSIDRFRVDAAASYWWPW